MVEANQRLVLLAENHAGAAPWYRLAYDGTRLIMSDGTAWLRFLNPQTLEETGRVQVKDAGRPVTQPLGGRTGRGGSRGTGARRRD